MTTAHDIHVGHDHAHGPNCGHAAGLHEGHVDCIHEEHARFPIRALMTSTRCLISPMRTTVKCMTTAAVMGLWPTAIMWITSTTATVTAPTKVVGQLVNPPQLRTVLTGARWIRVEEPDGVGDARGDGTGAHRRAHGSGHRRRQVRAGFARARPTQGRHWMHPQHGQAVLNGHARDVAENVRRNVGLL
jgi:hypothetical protein